MDPIDRALAELVRLNEDPGLIKSMIKVMEAFEDERLSPLARRFAVPYLYRLMSAKPLSPLVDDPQEWERVGDGLWRSTRDPEAFSKDGGKTYFLSSDADMMDPEPPPVYPSAAKDSIVLPETYRDAFKLFLEQSDLALSSGGVDDARDEG